LAKLPSIDDGLGHKGIVFAAGETFLRASQESIALRMELKDSTARTNLSCWLVLLGV
jgi:hypothetical protein